MQSTVQPAQYFSVRCRYIFIYFLILSQILFDQAQRSVKQQLHNFVKEWVLFLFPALVSDFYSISTLHVLCDMCVLLCDLCPRRDVRRFKETKKQFDKVREDMEIAQVKNAQAPRNKPHEVEEATSTLVTTRKCFRHLALDYVLQVFHKSITM